MGCRVQTDFNAPPDQGQRQAHRQCKCFHRPQGAVVNVILGNTRSALSMRPDWLSSSRQISVPVLCNYGVQGGNTTELLQEYWASLNRPWPIQDPPSPPLSVPVPPVADETTHERLSPGLVTLAVALPICCVALVAWMSARCVPPTRVCIAECSGKQRIAAYDCGGTLHYILIELLVGTVKGLWHNCL